jgi:hypothetical protein
MMLKAPGFFPVVSYTAPPFSLICVGDPGKGGSPLSFLLLGLVVAQAWGGGPWVRVKVERPQRSEDERP